MSDDRTVQTSTSAFRGLDLWLFPLLASPPTSSNKRQHLAIAFRLNFCTRFPPFSIPKILGIKKKNKTKEGDCIFLILFSLLPLFPTCLGHFLAAAPHEPALAEAQLRGTGHLLPHPSFLTHSCADFGSTALIYGAVHGGTVVCPFLLPAGEPGSFRQAPGLAFINSSCQSSSCRSSTSFQNHHGFLLRGETGSSFVCVKPA